MNAIYYLKRKSHSNRLDQISCARWYYAG